MSYGEAILVGLTVGAVLCAGWAIQALGRYARAYNILIRGCSTALNKDSLLPMARAMERSILVVDKKQSQAVARPESNGDFWTRDHLRKQEGEVS